MDAFFLARGFVVTGVDTSEEQIRLARQALHSGRFVQSDMTDVHFPPGSFEAIVLLLRDLPRTARGA